MAEIKTAASTETREKPASTAPSTANLTNDKGKRNFDPDTLEIRNPKLEDGRNGTSEKQRPMVDIQEYFVGPRDTDRFSKWPTVFRFYGSILPKMFLPLFIVGGWATVIRCISRYVHNLAVNQVLLTVLGFVVALALSFRTSSSYERYSEGRRYWAQLIQVSQILGRIFWVHGIERAGDQAKLDILAKKSGLNLIVAFAIALKHRLRFEPYTSIYDDLGGFVSHLETFAAVATEADSPKVSQPGSFKLFGQYVGLSFAESNPMETIRNSDMPLGNLPLEIMTYIGAFLDYMVENGQLKIPMQQTVAYNILNSYHDILTGCDRILHTPLPLAYTIAIHHITWMYIILLPFQLDATLKWISIPACVFAAYIILGLLQIGTELENPFGHDVNDLPLSEYCKMIAADLDVISSRERPNMKEIITSKKNKVLFPLSHAGYDVWAAESEQVIRGELKFKAEMMYKKRTSVKSSIKSEMHNGVSRALGKTELV